MIAHAQLCVQCLMSCVPASIAKQEFPNPEKAKVSRNLYKILGHLSEHNLRKLMNVGYTKGRLNAKPRKTGQPARAG